MTSSGEASRAGLLSVRPHRAEWSGPFPDCQETPSPTPSSRGKERGGLGCLSGSCRREEVSETRNRHKGWFRDRAGLWLLVKELGGARGSRPGSRVAEKVKRVAEKVKLGLSRLPCATDTSLLLLKFSLVGFGE